MKETNAYSKRIMRCFLSFPRAFYRARVRIKGMDEGEGEFMMTFTIKVEVNTVFIRS